MNLEKVIKYIIPIGILLLFSTSIFSVSEQYFNGINDAKFYYTCFTAICLTLLVSGFYKSIKISEILNKKTLFYINFICFIEACYGIGQYFKWFASYNNSFAVIGHFDNPAGLATVLSLGFGIGCFTYLQSTRITKVFLLLFNLTILLSLFFSESRAGIITVSITLITYLIYYFQSKKNIQKESYIKALFTFLTITFLGAGTILYKQKKDSANGRILIWTICTEMIKDKPFFGHGHGAFEAQYMNYQAQYFAENIESKHSQLADNVKHPFNLFFKITIAYGLLGLLLFLGLLVSIYIRIRRLTPEYKTLTINGLISILILSSVTYPFHYTATFLFLMITLVPIIPRQQITLKNNLGGLISRVAIVGICLILIYHLNLYATRNKQWKAIAQQSIKENNSSILNEYQKLYATPLKEDPYFLYNYGAELNVYKKYAESIEVLTVCQEKFNDYDVQMLLGQNYTQTKQLKKAIVAYKTATNMIPCRFLPVYFLFKTHGDIGNQAMAEYYAKHIIAKPVKVDSPTIRSIQYEAQTFLKENIR